MSGATVEHADAFGHAYEPWLFQTMIDELSTGELGISFVYSVLELLAERHGLKDAVVVITDGAMGPQAFRLGRETVDAEQLAKLGSIPGVYCDPDIVPFGERDAVHTACRLSLSLHYARYSAAHDPLTNIANRRYFDTALHTAAVQSSRYGWHFTLVLADLNGFKAVNDNSGHAVGDDLLRTFGFALRQSVRRGDTAARIGGDEFAVILSNAESNEVSGFTDRLSSRLAMSGKSVAFTIGTASSPRDSSNPDELLRIADARLYEKKARDHA
jgi:diguanylate cyclase (GGDEF)-like protein